MEGFLLKRILKSNISLNKGGSGGPLGMNIALEIGSIVIVAGFTQHLPYLERCCVSYSAIVWGEILNKYF